jgi:cation diffusion facilitator family transporter
MKAVFAALAANLGIAVAKFVAFLLTGSASMLAEAVHSLADTGNELLLIIGRGRSNRPRSEEHPFGFGRERYFYGFVVSVMLFTVGATFSVYQGVHKIASPETVHSPWVDYGVLALSAVLEAFSLRTGVREANQLRGARGWGTFIRHAKAPELPVVLLEDTAALFGLVFAFAGVALSALTGDGRWDGAGSLGIGALLAVAAAIVAVETKSLLIGESASTEMQRMILAALEEGPGVMQVIHLRTVHVGPDSLLVAGKIAVRATDTAAQVAADINAAEKRVRTAVPIATTIYLEPDIYRPALADQTDPSIQSVLRSRAPRAPRSPRSPRSRRPPASPASPASPAFPASPDPPHRDRPETPNSLPTPDNPSSPGQPSTPGKLGAQDSLSVSSSEKLSPSTSDKPREHEPPT